MAEKEYNYQCEDSVCGIIYNNVPYYFQKNLQGDIIGIVDKDSTVVARYSYDAWGKCTVDFIDLERTCGINIANINPFRYRGYYFDQGINLYYLQSRYYDPEVARFINGDESVYLGANGSLPGYNLITYCDNNPICFSDYFGNYIMYIYGKGQESSAKINIKLLKKKYLVYSYLVNSNSEFQKVWNKKGTNRAGKLAKIDILIINLHGNPEMVEFVDFKKLVKRNIDTLLLLSCNAGHLDYIDTNPATSFFVNNNIRQLVCCDGTHYRYNETKYVWKPTLFNWFRRKKNETVKHQVVGDHIFKSWCIRPRESSGFILYTRKRNNKITGYRSIGYEYHPITNLLSKLGK